MNLEYIQIELIPLLMLRQYQFNARTHSDEQIQQIADSMREFGFTNPILVDRNNMIIAGHGRFAAAELLGLREVPCLRLGDLDESQKRAYVLADNKLAENAGWDRSLLRLELIDLKDEGFDLGLIGFSADELDALLKAEGESDRDSDEEPEFILTITSKDEAEINALRKIFGVKKNAGKVSARAVLSMMPGNL
jgi:ParB family chromosome partitioning protein